MLTKIIYKNFRSNLKNYILFFLSNIVAIMELFVFYAFYYYLNIVLVVLFLLFWGLEQEEFFFISSRDY